MKTAKQQEEEQARKLEEILADHEERRDRLANPRLPDPGTSPSGGVIDHVPLADRGPHNSEAGSSSERR